MFNKFSKLTQLDKNVWNHKILLEITLQYLPSIYIFNKIEHTELEILTINPWHLTG